jgi:hypothetical protein
MIIICQRKYVRVVLLLFEDTTRLWLNIVCVERFN